MAQNSLADTQWRLSSFGSSGALASVIQGTTVTLKLGADGRASGSAGCNSYSGDYRVQGQTITFSRLISTKRACVNPEANQQETRYLAALESAGRFQSREDRLTIHYGNGRNTLNFANDRETQGGSVDTPLSVVSTFYDAVNARDFDRAYRLWETPPQNYNDFVRGYSDTASVKVLTSPDPTVEGAAGSSYAEIPTVILVRRRNGGERMYAGCYVTRKSNLEPPDTGSPNRGWRIYRAKLSPVSTTRDISSILNQACN
jgi:heat shock protein HslJ